MKQNSSIISLGLVFTLLFGAAFSCGSEGNSNEGNSSGSGDSHSGRPTSGGDRCSTEAEFKDVLNTWHSSTFNETDGKFRDTEIEFRSFTIDSPIRYTNPYPLVNAYPAYPVSVNYTVRDYVRGSSNPTIKQQEIKGRYIFYVDHIGKCVFADEASKSDVTDTPYNR